jgi:hypothetical protein
VNEQVRVSLPQIEGPVRSPLTPGSRPAGTKRSRVVRRWLIPALLLFAAGSAAIAWWVLGNQNSIH